MPTIWFKRQMRGQWRRDDGKSKTHVSKESMHREIEKLVNDGWTVRPYGTNLTRMIEVTKA